MRALKNHWRPLVFLLWTVAVYVGFFRQFAPYLGSIRSMAARLAGGS